MKVEERRKGKRKTRGKDTSLTELPTQKSPQCTQRRGGGKLCHFSPMGNWRMGLRKGEPKPQERKKITTQFHSEFEFLPWSKTLGTQLLVVNFKNT